MFVLVFPLEKLIKGSDAADKLIGTSRGKKRIFQQLWRCGMRSRWVTNGE